MLFIFNIIEGSDDLKKKGSIFRLQILDYNTSLICICNVFKVIWAEEDLWKEKALFVSLLGLKPNKIYDKLTIPLTHSNQISL